MTTKELAQELRKAQREVADSLSGATEPEMQTAPEPGEWTASEVAAHVIEMQAMWMEKIANAGEEPDLARSHSEVDRRTASVEAHSGDDIATVTRRLSESCDRTLEILEGISPSDLERPVTYGPSAKSGTALQAASSLVISHLSEHAQQIMATRRAVGGG